MRALRLSDKSKLGFEEDVLGAIRTLLSVPISCRPQKRYNANDTNNLTRLLRYCVGTVVQE